MLSDEFLYLVGSDQALPNFECAIPLIPHKPCFISEAYQNGWWNYYLQMLMLCHLRQAVERFDAWLNRAIRVVHLAVIHQLLPL